MKTDISFSQLIKFPDGETALFDSSVGAKAFEVTISDQSIFNPGGSNAQTAVRRAELMPRGDLVADNLTTTGIKTLHFSIKPSADRPLNVSHEYLMVFLERADFAGNLFMLRTGTLIGSDGSTKDDLVLFGNTQNGTQTLFTTPFEKTAFTNFALRLDFTQNTIQVFQSTGGAPLVQQTAPLPNDLSGNGDYHFGLNKNPTDPGADSLRSGFQESGINEGMVYGGIFIEDNANSTVTLS
ncbi:hypothetical protein SLS60_004922 [Paraconiothyrium brasiliense]|uniref:Glycoside hydrolase 131 catalytic N-terminal domain-containing protein n=1 Tax=Paraconiothyrium brasiliense TaxID=300254 RepID=A0ABR3RLQ8_9PLEO